MRCGVICFGINWIPCPHTHIQSQKPPSQTPLNPKITLAMCVLCVSYSLRIMQTRYSKRRTKYGTVPSIRYTNNSEWEKTNVCMCANLNLIEIQRSRRNIFKLGRCGKHQSRRNAATNVQCKYTRRVSSQLFALLCANYTTQTTQTLLPTAHPHLFICFLDVIKIPLAFRSMSLCVCMWLFDVCADRRAAFGLLEENSYYIVYRKHHEFGQPHEVFTPSFGKQTKNAKCALLNIWESRCVIRTQHFTIAIPSWGEPT